MTRPPCCRRVRGAPGAAVFKPAGIPIRDLPEVVMTLDEFEAIRLADLEGFHQEVAAEQMHVSRPTFGRILESAHRKIAETLTGGKVLRIEGGPVHVDGPGRHQCGDCRHEWEPGDEKAVECPQCHGTNLTEVPGSDGPCPRGLSHRRGMGRCHRRWRNV